MYIITNKANNIVLDFGAQVVYNGLSGFPAILGKGLFYPTSQSNLYNVKKVPDGLTPNEWTYDGHNFAPIVFEEPSEEEIQEESIEPSVEEEFNGEEENE